MMTLERYQKEKQIKDFIFGKLEDGWTVKKLNDGRYEFKKKTKFIDSVEKIHSDNFLTEFLKEK